MSVNSDFERMALGRDSRYPYFGCDGNDPGTPQQPSIWVFGIEWGWSKKDKENDAKGIQEPMDENYSVEQQLKWPYNRNVFKLLAAIKDVDPKDYGKFARQEKPFEKGSNGYFKGNIYPIPFNNVSDWTEGSKETGFGTKEEYREWCRRYRHPVIAKWVKEHKPKLLIGVGRSCLEDFMSIAGTTKAMPYEFQVNNHKKTICYSLQGSVPLVVVPHLSGTKHGLNSYKSIEEAAKFIRQHVLTITA